MRSVRTATILLASLAVTSCGGDVNSSNATHGEHDSGSESPALLPDASTDYAGETGGCSPGESKCSGTCCAGECVNDRCLVTLASGQEGPWDIVVDSANVYWVNEAGGTVMKRPTSAGAETLIASGQVFPTAIAVSAESVYWQSAVPTLAPAP